MNLLDTYKMNTGKDSLFSQIVTIDFYDGPTEAFCQLINSNDWYICSLVYFDPKNNLRIFSMVKTPDDWVSYIKQIDEKHKEDYQDYWNIKNRIEQYYKFYESKIHLFKSDWLLSIHYKVVEVKMEYLKYFDGLDAVVNQSNKSQLYWTSFF